MNPRPMLVVAVLLLAGAVAGCAHAPAGGSGTPSSAPPAAPAPSVRSAADPWEALNRRIFAFNDTVDAAVLKPVAQAYRDLVPEPLRQGVANVLANAEDAWSAVNHLLQGKPQQAAETGMRVGVNTVFGLLGVVDVASDLGLERHSEDFGQTLGRWGVGPGPYVVLPLLGPRTVRDTGGFLVDRQFDISQLPSAERDGYAITALELVNTRVGLLSTERILGQIALDRYTFIRDAYLAKRRNDIHDGNPPEEPDEDAAKPNPPRR